jgi:hypothetical protein
MKIERTYWTGGRIAGVPIHREIRIRRDDNLIVTLKPSLDGSCRVFAAGVMSRCQRDFTTVKAGLRYAVTLAAADPAIWRKGQASRDASAEFMANR